MIKEYAATLIREHISPSMRFALKDAAAWLRAQGGRVCLWRWEIARLPHRDGSPYNILYVGRKSWRELAKILMGVKGDDDASQVKAYISGRTVFVSELPIPGTLCVPWYLRAIVPLGRSIEDITAGYDGELRRSIRKYRARYRMQQALSDIEIDRADREMLRPYASARNGSAAVQIAPDEVRKVAQNVGRLDLVLCGDEVVACHLGSAITRAGKRYWSTIRFGYPETVFSDSKRLRETNSINTYLALEWAIKNGFDYYDIGTSIGCPDDGLLQWKRRRGGAVDTMGHHGYFHVRLPRAGAAQFLWDAPLFAVEQHKLTLHLGLPDGPSDEEVASRYRQMGFGGLFKIYLYCARPPSENLLEKLRSLYANQKLLPIVESITST